MIQTTLFSESSRTLIFRYIIFYFAFLFLFPSLRGIVIGSHQSENLPEYIFSALPEMLIIFLAGIFAFHYIRAEKKPVIKLSMLDKLMILFLVINVIFGVMVSGNMLMAVYGFRSSYLAIIFYFFARLLPLNKEQDILSLTGKVFRLLLIIAVYSLVVYFVFPGFETYMHQLTGSIQFTYFYVRMASLFYTPILLGAFMTLGAIYCYHSALKEYRLYKLLCFALFFSCLYLSVSRGALITFTLGFIVLSLSFRSWKTALRFGFAAILISASLVFFLNMRLQKQNQAAVVPTHAHSGSVHVGSTYDSTVHNADKEKYYNSNISMWMVKSSLETISMNNSESRVQLWEESLHNFLQHPMGYGLGKSGHVAYRFFRHENAQASVSTTDGWYLKLANETGVVGIFLYLLLFCFFIYRNLKKNIFRDKRFSLFVFVMFIIVAVQNLGSNILDLFSFSCFYWFLMGLSENLFSLEDSHAKA